MIYLDACILIYAVEDQGTRGASVRRAFRAADAPLATSALILPECLPGPLRAQDHALRDRYLAVFERLEIIELGTQSYLRAAQLRAGFGLKTPDAIHLAAAQLAGCTQFWTNDRRLAAASNGLAVDIIGG
ncbi:PIN domain-containing protein [Microbacterium pseudoresistens]|nr:type II toxin-antitoxin system VapC family toxin [Microbacterium pseudoresistens]